MIYGTFSGYLRVTKGYIPITALFLYVCILHVNIKS
jgi:hypothetical protein